jgi:hypothetical protein
VSECQVVVKSHNHLIENSSHNDQAIRGFETHKQDFPYCI